MGGRGRRTWAEGGSLQSQSHPGCRAYRLQNFEVKSDFLIFDDDKEDDLEDGEDDTYHCNALRWILLSQ